MKRIINKHMIILFALVASLLLMTTMYAAINSVTGDIQGKVIAEKQTGVYITDVQYVSDIDADLGASTIKNFKGTFMQNTVKLSNTNSASEIKYKVTVYNNSDKSYPFLAVLYDEEFYDNLNIIFEISSEGYKIGDIINPHETRDIFITFKYKDGQIPQNTILNANLNFKIADPNRMMSVSFEISESTLYLRGSINKDKIETIKFELGKIEPPGTISSFDASEKQDGSIMGYYTDANNDGLYDLTFASNEPIYANVHASNLFSDLKKSKNIEFFNFSTFGTISMSGMFGNCESLNSLDVSKFDTSEVVIMYGMFIRCKNITSLDLSNFHTSQVHDMCSMFSGCSNLKSLNVTNFDTSKVTDMDSMFAHCTSLKDLDISGFDTSQVTDMGYMFGECREVTNIDVSNFNTSNVTDMPGMFCGCDSVSVLDVSNFNTSNVIDMMSMFLDCQNLTFLNVSNFDTSKVTNMRSIFSGCKILTTLDLSKFNTNQVTNMELMFYNCSSLTTIYASEFNPTTNTGWTTSSVTNSTDMFINATKLIGGYGTKYDANHIDKEYARLDKKNEPGYLSKKGTKPGEIFDEQGTNLEGLHIGDFVNYDAGIWTQEEINAIKVGQKSNLVTASGSKNLPNKLYQFGGFTAESSRNESATPNSTSKNGIIDKTDGKPITGWRVFDIDGNKITLISAGNPEDYGFYLTDNGNEAYKSEYILTENIVTNIDEYQKRDWSNYVNESQGGRSATALGITRLKVWYNKYVKTGGLGFSEFYDKEQPYIRYQNIIDNNTYYTVPSLANDRMGKISPNGRDIAMYYNATYGIRILVSLSSDVLLNKIGEKTLTSPTMEKYGGEQTYNIWNINKFDITNPQIMYNYSKIEMKNNSKSIRAVFSITDENFEKSSITIDDIKILIDNAEPDWTKVTKEIFNITDITEKERVIGKKYEILISNLKINEGNENVIMTIPQGKARDTFGNTNEEHTIKIEINKGTYSKPSEIFDKEGTNPDGLHIGDFVNYDAGTWTQEEIDAIKVGPETQLVSANGVTKLPKQLYEFGGFRAGQSRNGNATPAESSKNGIKDKLDGKTITGWRVFDIDGDKITLISAGNPEDYGFHLTDNGHEAYKSEYILTGNILSKVDGYQKRDWTNYVNKEQGAKSATALGIPRLKAWHNKYVLPGELRTYELYTEEKYRRYLNLIDNDTYYFLPSLANDRMGYVSSGGLKIEITYAKTYGIRILVSLSSDILVEKIGQKTLSSPIMEKYGGERTYNVWGINKFDAIRPEIEYDYSKTETKNNSKSIRVGFSVTDENFEKSSITIDDIKILIDNAEPDWKRVTKTISNTTDIIEKINDTDIVIGKRYEILISNLNINEGNENIIITIPQDKVMDTSGNTNYDQTITIGTNDGTYLNPGKIFDNEGTNPDGLHIGDFVNYDAGTWTQEEIDAIKVGLKSELVSANGVTKLPDKLYEFGGFRAGQSRNGNATINNPGKSGIKDTLDGKAITGWRVFDIDGDKITLISAGNPEDYGFYPTNQGKEGYKSEYILTGNINSEWKEGIKESENYQKRDWSKYVNESQGGESATALGIPRLKAWHNKYVLPGELRIYELYTEEKYRRYLNLIDNDTYYFLPSLANDRMGYVSSGVLKIEMTYAKTYGIRILVSLSSDVLLKKTGEKTLISTIMEKYGGYKTYNMWEIQVIN